MLFILVLSTISYVMGEISLPWVELIADTSAVVDAAGWAHV